MKDSPISLSIIIPYKNVANYLRRLLESIYSSELEDVEVIVTDDHSDENREEYRTIQKEFQEVIYLENAPEKKSAGAARNTALQKARGKWLLFADSDDRFLDGWYEKVRKYFDSEYDIIYFRPTSEKEGGRISYRHSKYAHCIEDYFKKKSQRNEDRIRTGFVVPWSKLIRCSLVKDNGIQFDEIRHNNDSMFSVKSAWNADKITVDMDSIYCVNEREGNLTSDKNLETLYERVQVHCRRYNYVKERIGEKRLRETDIGVLYIATINNLLKSFHQGNYDRSMAKKIMQSLKDNHIAYILPFWYIKKTLKMHVQLLKKKIYSKIIA